MQYIRIDKSLLELPIFSSPSVRCLWLNLLFLADWETGEVRVGGRTLADYVGISHKAVRGSLEKLAENGLITIGKGTLGAQARAHPGAHQATLVTICNYDNYRGFRNRPGTPRGTLGAQESYNTEQSGNLFIDSTLELDSTQENERLTKTPNTIPPIDIISDNTIAPLSSAPIPDRKVIPPKYEWVEAYCKQRNKSVDPKQWYAHYQSNGWKVGKVRMVDWQAAVRTWERNPAKKKQDNSRWDELQRDLEEINAMYKNYGANGNNPAGIDEQ